VRATASWIEITFGEPPKLSPLRIAGASMKPSKTVAVGEAGRPAHLGLGAGLEVRVSWRRLGGRLVEAVFELPEEPLAYGLGERHAHLNLWGRRFRLWNVDQPMHLPLGDPPYLSVPYVLLCWPGRACTAILADHAGYAEFDLGRDDPRAVKIVAETCGAGLRAYVLSACGPAEAVASLTKAFPTPTLPPKWGLGYHQSRYSYASAEEVLEVAHSLNKYGVPCDAIYLDIDYMDSYKVFTWDKDRFPDPEGLAAKLAELRVRLVTIVDVGVKVEASYRPYEEGVEGGYFMGCADGGLFEGGVWPGTCVFPDLLREDVREWWASLMADNLLKRGASGLWLDMNEPAMFYMIPEVRRVWEGLRDAVGRGGWGEAGRLLREAAARISTYGYPWLGRQDVRATHRAGGAGEVRHEEIHNLYGLLEAMAAVKAFKKALPGARPFILSRSGWAGIQSYAAVWTGDNQSCWEHLRLSIPELLNLGLSGIHYVGADVGGFEADATPELLLRWLQAGAFYPLYRNHSSKGTVRQEPWAFGSEWLPRFREAIRLRYEFLPHIYVEFLKSIRSGLPVMRPLFLEFPGDRVSYLIDDEFMVGDSLLVAPIMEPGARARATYLPPGTGWAEFRSGAEVGEGWVLSKAGLDDIPLYVRGDSAVLTTTPKQRAEDPWNPLIVNAYLRRRVEALLYDDDGETLDYLRGRRFEAVLTLKLRGEAVEADVRVVSNSYEPSFRRVRLRFQRGLKATHVIVGGEKIPLEDRGSGPEAEVSLKELTAGAGRA